MRAKAPGSLSTLVFGPTRLNTWILSGLTLLCVVTVWMGAFDERMQGEAGLALLLPIAGEFIFGFLLIGTVFLGWSRLRPGERGFGLVVGMTGLLNWFLVSGIRHLTVG
jgi:hypothetical protein